MDASPAIRDQIGLENDGHSKNCSFVKTIAVLTAIAIPIITTTFAYVGAFKLLKLRMINPKFALALKIIVPAKLGFGIVLTEVLIYVCIVSANKKRNNLLLDDRMQDLYEDEREIRKCGSEFLKFFDMETLKEIPKESRRECLKLTEEKGVGLIRPIFVNDSVIRGIYFENSTGLKKTFIAMKLDVIDSNTEMHVNTVTEVVYQHLCKGWVEREMISCQLLCTLDSNDDIQSLLQRPCFDSDRDSPGIGGGMEDVRRLLKGEEITVSYGGKLRELNSCYYDRDFAIGMEPTLFILRLHREEDNEFMEEKFQFMKEKCLHVIGIGRKDLFFPYLFLHS